MSERPIIGKRALIAYQCGLDIAKYHPGAEHVIRVFNFLPSELCTPWELEAYTKMPNKRFWHYFWLGHEQGVLLREGRI